MSPKKSPHFDYDFVLSMNASHRLRDCLPAIEMAAGDKKILAATLNHRFFKLHEKNMIKGNVEAHLLDQVMFSIRPSSFRFIADQEPAFVERFKDLSQVIFVLQCLARYSIREAIIEPTEIEFDGNSERLVRDIQAQILSFLEELRSRWTAKGTIEKQFPWLFSIRGKLHEIGECRLISLNQYVGASAISVPHYNDEQIGYLEKDLFWIGFDSDYLDVPKEKPYPATTWTQRAEAAEVGRPIFDGKLRYCTRCCLPETMEGITFDEFGICVPCRSSEEKMHINWDERRKGLDALIEQFRSEDYYDCMLPMGGGKDSTYQAHILKHVLRVTPLAVTHGFNWMSLAGRYNLENCLQKFDQDHLIFCMNRKIVNRMARKGLGAIGDACWHCHIGAGTFPIQSAMAWDVGLMCWGESIAEADGRGSYQNQKEASLYYNLEVSAKVKAEDLLDQDTKIKDVSAWVYPSREVLRGQNIRYIHLGDFFFWDEERQVEFLKRNYEWMESIVENTYKGFKSVECVMAGVHDYSNFLKRGIGRATIQASTDVRRGLLTREEGFELAKKYDTQRPHALDFYLRLTGLSEAEFEATLKEARTKSQFAMKLEGK
jgi:N-acetyl sugar amidotransferase